ncbi:PKD domain-containing protein [Sanyastnella coralliicola]|uniref:PKD domain-containing protein n=1 Tax=Sanyastnella coralliicola TaxID=3069118 RepID=UPI0027BADB6C|nr:PKD domain-containing protein [Longitalea sp. SCSIO 12813]
MTDRANWLKYSLSLCLVLFAQIAFTQCEVDAGDDITICQGETVTLGGSPTIVEGGGGVGVQWSNGLGNGENPTVTPNSTTTYTVNMTGGGCGGESDQITVTVLPSPEADFNFSPNGECGGTTVNFTSTSSGNGLSYDWNFGNPGAPSNSSTQQNPSHEFVAPGNGNTTFTVTLTVTDSNGCVDSFSQTVDVQESPDPTITDADIFTPFVMCGAQGQVTFDLTINNGSTTTGTNTNYFIDWGDASAPYDDPSFTSLTHTYTSEGFYNLTVTVTGDNGCENTANYEVFAGSNPSIGLANPGATINLCAPNTLVFPLTNYENNSPGTEYTITFSDGSPPETFVHPPPASVEHTFNISSCDFTSLGGFANSFYVQIIAENPCGFSAATIEPIQTSSAPTAAMDVFPGTEGCAGSPFTFTNVSTNSNFNNNGNCTNLMTANWSIEPASGWTVTGGSLTDPDSFSAVFDPGTYTITMVGANPCGDDEVSIDICVTTPPEALFAIDPVSGCAPLEVPTTNLSSSLNNCDNESYLWEITPNTGWFVSSGSTTAIDPEFTFTQEGTYTIELNVTNLCGTDIYTQQVTVVEPPAVDLSPIPSACQGTNVTPIVSYDNGGGTISSYDWDFTGGTPDSFNGANPPNVSYPNTGNYTVTITIENECGVGSDSESFLVETAPTVTLSAVDDELCNGQATTLTANGAVTYDWTPAPGLNVINGNQATVNPSSTTTYEVTGYSAAGCIGTASITIDVNPLPVVVPDGTFEICAGDCVDLAVSVSGGQAPYTTYNWTPAGTLDDPSSPTPEACPPFSETYTVSVTDANGCVGQTNVPVTVNPLPAVNAGTDVTLCDQPVAEQLTGFSPLGGTWTGPNVTAGGEFTPSGTGLVTLTYTFTDANGCTNSDDLEVDVIAPTTADAGPDLEICQLSPAEQLVPVTPGGTWSGTDVSVDGLFTPNTVGTFTLTYELGGGSCLSTDQIEVEVFELPVVDAGMDDNICEGDSIQLGAAVSGGELPYATEEWLASPFISDVTDPNTYASPTTTTVFTFTVTDDNGCVDSDDVTINVLSSPVVEAGPNIILCNQPIGEQLTGFSPIAGAGETGEWSGPDIDVDGLFTPSQPGTFTVYYTFTNIAGCTNIDSCDVTVIDPTLANAGPDLGLCLNGADEVLANGGTWTGDNVTPEGVFSPTETGTFDLTYTIGVGTCETSDDLQITVFELPTVDAGLEEFICEEDSTQLSALASSPNGAITDYTWTGVGLSDAAIADPWASPVSTTTFTVEVTDVEGCQASDDVTVNVNGLPVVDAGPDLTLCDQPIAETLTGFSPLPDMTSTGEWTGTGITNADGEFTSPGVGNYTLYYTFTDIAGCVNLDSIQVEVVPPVIAEAGPVQEMCLNNGQYELLGYTPTDNVTWSGDGVVDAAEGIFDPLVSGDGTFTLYLEFGSGTCYTIDSTEVTVLPLPQIIATDTSLCDNVGISPLPEFSPIGGTWEGVGVFDPVNGTYDPAVPTDIDNDIFYWYTDPNTGCADTVNVVVGILPSPLADFTVAPLGCTNGPVDVTNNSDVAATYDWDWGNGDTSTGFDPEYTYPDEGIFDIELIVAHDWGCSDTLVISNEIIDPPTAALTITPDEGCAPLEVAFENNAIGQYLDFEWDLSVTTTTDTVPANVIYQQGDDVLEYEVSLTANNFCGTDIAVDTVTVFPQPVAGFGTDYDEFCTPWDAQINNTSVGNPDIYEWDFGDGTGSALEEPGSHVFYTDSLPTDYTITLITTNECGVDTFAYTITVLPNTVTAFFNTDTTQGCEPLTVEFTDFSEGGTVIAYDFGDDNLSNDPNPVHTFTEAGEYTIYQYVNNGCSFDTTTAQVVVFDSPELDFTTDVPNVCENQPVQFINLSEDVNNVIWDLGDGTETDLTNPTHLYQDGGTFDVTITATSMFNECEATLTQPFTVFAAPETEFSVADQVGCSPFVVNFNNDTQNGNFYQWDFGDNETGNGPDVTHTFFNDTAEPALYTVTLISENLQLCADTFQMDIIVSPTPITDFSLSETESCTFPITLQTFNNTQFADGYEWDFAPFGNSDLAEPEITFDQIGTWDVTLTASNAYGCETSETEPFIVHPAPTASYTANPTWGCIDLPVSFTNESDGTIIDYQWTFGDGGVSTLPNPTHTYSDDGYFDVQLIVTTDQGCVDTMFVDNQVQAYPLPIADFTFSPEETTIYSPEIDFVDQSFDPFSWFWDFGDGYLSSEQNPSHIYELPGVYLIELTVQNIYGCEDRAVGQVTIDDQFNIYVPNAFTPDGDNVNDVFRPEIVGEGMVDFYELLIFDRWGMVVFETNDMDAVWLGDFRDGGEYYVQTDTYIWQVKYRLKGAEESEIVTGHVNLIR